MDVSYIYYFYFNLIQFYVSFFNTTQVMIMHVDVSNFFTLNKSYFSFSGVSAIDFGSYNYLPQYQPLSFRELTNAINNSQCWVSKKCIFAQ